MSATLKQLMQACVLASMKARISSALALSLMAAPATLHHPVMVLMAKMDLWRRQWPWQSRLDTARMQQQDIAAAPPPTVDRMSEHVDGAGWTSADASPGRMMNVVGMTASKSMPETLQCARSVRTRLAWIY